MTLKQGKHYQTWYELVDPEQDYNNAKFERPPLHSVRQKANLKVLVKSGDMSIIYLKYVRKSEIVVFHDLPMYLAILQKFNLI